jgi:hypothetical protein
MFSGLQNRKRRWPSELANDAAVNSKPEKMSSPLKGAVICLTGWSQEEKERMHHLIEHLGGE